jgi:maltose/moltooligosaccharide transporter
MVKPRLPFWQIVNMSIGFFGIQFGWSLQMSNMSAIYEYLGANADQLPLLWLAAPMTGLLVQPIIGHLSDHTWGFLGRRRPYFLTGAILSSLALLAMPNASALWMAAGLLWILDASINISMEPFRAFVADMLPDDQTTTGFAMQSFFIGLGSSIAAALPWMLHNWFHVGNASTGAHSIPLSVRMAFYLGSPVFLGAVLWTIFTTKEYPPEDMVAFRREKAAGAGIGQNVREIVDAVRAMPATMRQLCFVQFATWMGLFCMFLYFPPAVARSVFGAPDTASPLYAEGIEWGGNCLAFYSVVCFAFSFVLPGIARSLGRRMTHSLCLLCGAAGLFSVAVIHDKWMLLLSMVGVGIAWASILAMPYAILAGCLPKQKVGIYMGVFNFAIVLPEITAALSFGWIMSHLLDNNRVLAMGGGIDAVSESGSARRGGASGMIRLAILVFCCALAHAAPVVTKVDPPNWWTGHSINPVRVLIRGTGLAGARVSPTDTGVSVSNVRVNTTGTYVFADLRVNTPGKHPLRITTTTGTATAPFEVLAPLPRAGRFQGFSPDDLIYLIMPDRFANGDPSNDDPAVSKGLFDRSKPRYYHGGDLQGIIDRLPYLKDLGVTALWINPLYDNVNHLNEKEKYDGAAITDYHGYGAVDFYGVEEHFGDMAKFRELSDKAHAAGIKIILDMVANHSGPYHSWVTDPPLPDWFHGTAGKHIKETWQTWTLMDPHAPAELRRPTLDGWFIDILPDLNQDEPEVARYIIQNTLWWVGMAGLDGIRQDTMPYVPRTFWRDWMAAIHREYPKLRVVGEVFDGDASVVSFFQGGKARFDGVDSGVDTLFDFPSYYGIRHVFANGQPVKELAAAIAHDALYQRPEWLVTFLGLHDVTRFLHESGANVEGLKLAFTYLLTTRGIPMIYYGDEIGMDGGDDPDNRRDFPVAAFTQDGRTREQRIVFEHVRQLAALRARTPGLRQGAMTELAETDFAYAYSRGEDVIVAINNGKAAETLNVAGKAGMWRDQLGDGRQSASQDGRLIIPLAPRSAVVLVRRP